METERIKQIQDSSWEETTTIVDSTMEDSTVGLIATLAGEGGDRPLKAVTQPARDFSSETTTTAVAVDSTTAVSMVASTTVGSTMVDSTMVDLTMADLMVDLTMAAKDVNAHS